MELAGNKAAKEYFNRVGVPLIGDIFDYPNEKITKYKNDLASRVKDTFGTGFDDTVVSKNDENFFKNENNDKIFEEIVEKKEVLSNRLCLLFRGSIKIQ